MDATDLSKIANRKRINSDVEKLRDKVSRETAKIIKLKVAQDTAYWDLKEKLQAVESNHERLQRNMVEVQMQHEALSARHERERRLRPDAAARAAASRHLCDALDEYAARLRAALRRAAADRANLATAYAAAGAAVSQAHAHHAAAAAAARATGAHAADMMRDLRVGADRLALELARRDRALQEKESVLGELRCEGDRRAAELAEERERARHLAARLHDEVRTREAIDRELRGEIARRDVALAELKATREALSADLAAAVTSRDRLQLEASQLRNDLEGRAAELEEVREKMANLARDAEQQRERAAAAERARDEVEAERDALVLNAERAHAAAARDLQALRDEVRANADRLEAERTERTRLEGELHDERERGVAAAAASERELASRADTIARLMADVAGEAEARARAEAALRAARSDLEAMGARAADAERTARRREEALRDKEAELTTHAALVRELRADKDRLQDKICGMQATIDNIQKELTRPPPGAAPHNAPAAEHPEHDTAPPKRARREPEAHRRDSLLYTFLSDSSVDGDILDPAEVNRRFDALSQCGPPAPRRAGAADQHSLLQVKSGLQNKPKSIFKTKRQDSKVKKHKF